MKKALILLVFCIPPAYAATPTWVRELSPRLIQGTLQVVCHGDGPDHYTAFLTALDECRSVAAQSILQDFQVKTLVVQTESNSALHEEVTSDYKVTGLHCDVKNSYEVSNELWLLCSFDPKTAKIIPTHPSLDKPTLKNPNDQYLILSVSPQCDTVIVESPSPRVIPCDKNPLPITVKKNETLIIRAKGYIPVHVTSQEPQISVFLDRN